MSVLNQVMGAAGASGPATYVEDVFSTYLYPGNGGTQTINIGIDLVGKRGLALFKHRTRAEPLTFFDSARPNAYLTSNSSNPQIANSGVTFNSNGFSLTQASDFYNSSYQDGTYVSWIFREQPKFFTIVTYTGNGVQGRAIPHPLGSVPGCIIIKQTSGDPEAWPVYHRSLGAGGALYLNGTGAAFTGLSGRYPTVPTSTEFYVGNATDINASGQTYVAYIYAHNAGGFGLTGTDDVISCGSFTTNGIGNASINLGYEPQWVLVKPAGQAGNWDLMDTMRGFAQTSVSRLQPNTSSAEGTVAGNYLFPTATGFELAQNFYGLTSTQFIYIAIRRGPMKVPTDGTKVFAPVAYTGTGSERTTASGFVSDLAIIKSRGVYSPSFEDRLRGANKVIQSNGTGAEVTTTEYVLGFDVQDGVRIGTDAGVNGSGTTYIDWNFRRAPNFFDEVCYSGNGTGDRALTHNLGIAPEMMILKCRNTSGTNWSWWVYHKDIPNTPYPTNMMLNSTDAAYAWGSNINTPTSTTFTVRDAFGNGSGNTFVSYLFATCTGVSKVGSYTGNGSSQTINCGFTGGARFVLIKRTDSTGDWYVWDTARGIVAGNDPHLSLNTTAAEVTSNDTIDPASSGFIVNQVAATNVNVSGATYIFLAIA